MRTIPHLFMRGTRDVDPACRWAAEGEGEATIKVDGEPVLWQDGALYRRYVLRAGTGDWPRGWFPAQPEPGPDGAWPGWRPIPDGKGARPYLQALAQTPVAALIAGTSFELVGPRVRGNPYRLRLPELVPHGAARIPLCPRDYDGLRAFLAAAPIEGVVFWREPGSPDGGMCKVTRRELGLWWPLTLRELAAYRKAAA